MTIETENELREDTATMNNQHDDRLKLLEQWLETYGDEESVIRRVRLILGDGARATATSLPSHALRDLGTIFGAHHHTADSWNATYPIGTAVRYWPVYPPINSVASVDTKTRSAAWAIGDGSVVVLVEGKLGVVDLPHIEVLPGTQSASNAATARWRTRASLTRRLFVTLAYRRRPESQSLGLHSSNAQFADCQRNPLAATPQITDSAMRIALGMAWSRSHTGSGPTKGTNDQARHTDLLPRHCPMWRTSRW